MTRPGTANPAVIDVVTAAASAAAVANRQHGDRDDDGDGDDAGDDAEPRRRPGRRGQRLELVAERLRARLVGVGDARQAHWPSDTTGTTRARPRTQDHERHRRRLPAPSGTARLRRVAAPVRWSSGPRRRRSMSDGGERHDDEDRRRRERGRPVGEPRGVDDAGERVEAEQLHGSELAQAVQQRRSASRRRSRRGRAAGRRAGTCAPDGRRAAGCSPRAAAAAPPGGRRPADRRADR